MKKLITGLRQTHMLVRNADLLLTSVSILIVTNILRNSYLCNGLLLVPNDMPEGGTSILQGTIEETRALFSDWDLRILKLLALCRSVSKW